MFLCCLAGFSCCVGLAGHDASCRSGWSGWRGCGGVGVRGLFSARASIGSYGFLPEQPFLSLPSPPPATFPSDRHVLSQGLLGVFSYRHGPKASLCRAPPAPPRPPRLSWASCRPSGPRGGGDFWGLKGLGGSAVAPELDRNAAFSPWVFVFVLNVCVYVPPFQPNQ